MKTVLLLVSIVFVANFTSIRLACAQDVPPTISYQGVLKSSDGTPANGAEPMTIRLYSDSAGTQLVWEDAFTPNVQNGIFNVMLGSQKPLPSATQMNVPLWLAVSVGGGDPMKPYSALATSPYALNAASANALAPGAQGAITSINGKTGDLTLKAGPGTSILADGNTLIISQDAGTNSKSSNDKPLDVAQSIIGTNHQVYADGTYGVKEADNVTLTLPQNIDSVSTPHFVNISLNNIPSGSSDTNILVSNGGVLQTRTISSLISAVPTVALSGNLQANGLLESGHTIIINGDSMPHSIWSDSTLNISSGTGNISINAASAHVGIGTLTPDSALEVAGGFHEAGSARFDGPITASGFFGDGSGLTNLSAWSLKGNTGTNPDSNFIGTTDSTDLIFRTNNQQGMRLSTTNSLSVGQGAMASGKSSIAFGYGAQATTDNAVAIGVFGSASGVGSIALGVTSNANGYMSTAAGGGYAAGQFSIAIGFNAEAIGNGAVALGCNSSNYADDYLDMGVYGYTLARGDNSFAVGPGATAGGLQSVAMGENTSASGELSTAFGHGTSSSGYASFATGDGSNASGYASFAAMGSANGDYSFAASGGIAEGSSSIAMGSNTLASGNYTIALGENSSTNTKSNSFAYGDGSAATVNDAASQFMVRASGGYKYFDNATATPSMVLTGGKVGIGTATPASMLDVNGTANITGNMTIGGTLDLSGQTGGMIVPVGTTAQRPASPVAGTIRLNTTTGKFEGYDGSAWSNLN